MDRYIQDILNALWDIPGWPKKEAIDRRKVNQWVRKFPPEVVDLLKCVEQYDTWCGDNEIGSERNKNPRSRFERWVRNAIDWNSAVPKSHLSLTVEDQLQAKQAKRAAGLARLGATFDA